MRGIRRGVVRGLLVGVVQCRHFCRVVAMKRVVAVVVGDYFFRNILHQSCDVRDCCWMYFFHHRIVLHRLDLGPLRQLHPLVRRNWCFC